MILLIDQIEGKFQYLKNTGEPRFRRVAYVNHKATPYSAHWDSREQYWEHQRRYNNGFKLELHYD